MSAAESASHADALLVAMGKAQQAMRATVASRLRMAGATWSTPAQDNTAAVWDQDAWSQQVERFVIPAATLAARDAVTNLQRRFRPVAMADPVPMMVEQVRRRALAGGPLIGRRLSARSITAAAIDVDRIRQLVMNAPQRYGGVVHPEAQPTVADAYQQAFGVLDDLVANAAAQMGNAAAAALGVAANSEQPNLVQHVWTAMLDDRTREDHADADGQVQDAGDSFDVGGESLMYPGDPSGSDEQTCNCRCYIEIVGLEAAGEDEESGAA